MVEVQEKMFKSCLDEEFFYVQSDLKLTLTLTLTVTLTLGLGLELTPWKTISVENVKPNAKHEYCRRRPKKNH